MKRLAALLFVLLLPGPFRAAPRRATQAECVRSDVRKAPPAERNPDARRERTPERAERYSSENWPTDDDAAVQRRLRPLHRPRVGFRIEQAAHAGDSLWIVVRIAVPHGAIRRGECFEASFLLHTDLRDPDAVGTELNRISLCGGRSAPQEHPHRRTGDRRRSSRPGGGRSATSTTPASWPSTRGSKSIPSSASSRRSPDEAAGSTTRNFCCRSPGAPDRRSGRAPKGCSSRSCWSIRPVPIDMKGLFLSMTLLLCPPPYGNAETSAATASQEASDPRFRAELDTLGGLRAGVEYTLRYECTAPCGSDPAALFPGADRNRRGGDALPRDPPGAHRRPPAQIHDAGPLSPHPVHAGRSCRSAFRHDTDRRPEVRDPGGARPCRTAPAGLAGHPLPLRAASRTSAGGKRIYRRARLHGPARQRRSRNRRRRTDLPAERIRSGKPERTPPATNTPSGVRAEREGRYTIRTAGLRFGGREYALSREVRIGRTGADAPDPDSPESRDARPATRLGASDREHPFFLLFGGLPRTLTAAEWLRRQAIRPARMRRTAGGFRPPHRPPAADRMAGFDPLRTAAGPRPAAGGHSRHRRIHRRILPRDLRRLPVEMVRRAAARAGRHHGPPPVPQAPLHAGPHTAEGRGFRPPAGGAVPASRVGTAPLRHGLLRRTHAPRIPDPFVGRTALRRLRQRGGADQQHQRSGRAHGDLLLRPQPP